MQFRLPDAALLSIALALQVRGQTAPGTKPTTSQHLGVAFGSTILNANDLLPQAREFFHNLPTDSHR